MPIPEIRFSEFDQIWAEFNLGDIATFSKGKGVSKSDIDPDGELSCIRYGELYTTYNELIKEVYSRTNQPIEESVLSKTGDVIIPASGETSEDISTASCVLLNGVALGGDLNIIRSTQYGPFLAYYLSHKRKFEIAALAQGNSVVHLYAAQLRSLRLNLPSLPEQQRIADFLSAVDKKIQLLTRKKELLEQYKKGVMQRLFSREIRFKEFKEKWKVVKLENICTFFSGGTPATSNRNYYKGTIPFVKSGEIRSEVTEQYISEEALLNSSAKMIDKGDIVYALYGATAGEVAISKIKGAINQAILCIKTTHERRFVYYYLLMKKERILTKYLQGGQGNLSAAIVKNINIPIPSRSEQERISDFLSSIDKKIELLIQQIETMKQFKKGLLQQMFV